MTTQNEKDAVLFAIAELFLALKGNMNANAVRFDEDKIPTYGLRVAEQSFGTAYQLISQQSIPVQKPITIVLEAAIKGAGIGIKAWAQSLKDDWGMIAPKCGAHCKLCSSRSTALYFKALSEIINHTISTKSKWNKKETEKISTISDSINKSLVDYADEVIQTSSFSNAWIEWDAFGDNLISLAGPLTNLLSSDY
jgi:hypothetical protein